MGQIACPDWCEISESCQKEVLWSVAKLGSARTRVALPLWVAIEGGQSKTAGYGGAEEEPTWRTEPESMSPTIMGPISGEGGYG